MSADIQLERKLTSLFESEASLNAPIDLHAAAMARVRRSRQRSAVLAQVVGDRLPVAGTRLAGPRTLVLVVVALIVLAFVAVLLAGALRRESAGWITYSLAGMGAPDADSVWRVRADGTGDHQVAIGDCQSSSADGKSVVFWSSRADVGEWPMAVEHGDGSSQSVLNDIEARDAAISPNGSKVAWVKELEPILDRQGHGGVGSVGELWVSPIDGGPSVLLVERDAAASVSLGTPVWNARGDRIAFAKVVVSFTDEKPVYDESIWVVNADGSELRQFASSASEPTWSPDGRSLAFIRVIDFSPRLIVGAVDGSGETVLSIGEDYPWEPSWSPDGRYIAYRSAGGIATIGMSGGIPIGPPNVRLTATGSTASNVGPWSPDGRRLLVFETTNGPLDESLAGSSSRILSLDAALHDAPTLVLDREGIILTYPFCSASWRSP